MAGRIEQPTAYWSCAVDQLLANLQTTRTGLSTFEAQKRLQAYGSNTLNLHKSITTWGLFLNQFKSPLVLILILAAAISVLVSDWTEAAVILAIVIGSAAITFAQEYRANNAIDRLRSRLTHSITALRDGTMQEVAVETIVPGDIVRLSVGSLIPADGVVIHCKDFFIDQAVMTGESFPVEKAPGVTSEQASMAERINCVFMGTNVRSGSAQMVVVETGLRTAYGQIAHKLSLRPPETEFERGIRRFGYLLTQIMVILILIVFAINVFSAKPPVESLLFAIALAVGISPELLPAIITITLSHGAREMARHGVIVRQLNAIENFGSMDVLCTDKTGTLTQGVVRLDGALDVRGQPSKEVFRFAYLNAHFQTGLVNPLDKAITEKQQLDLAQTVKLDEIPYDFVRKRLSVVIRESNEEALLISKGALEKVLAVCNRMKEGEQVITLGQAEREHIERLFTEASDKGFRVLGVGVKSVPLQPSYAREEEVDLIFIGFLTFFDPPKPDAQKAIAALRRLGVRLKIITGDNWRVAKHIAEMVELPIEGILTGAELGALKDEALWHHVEHTDLFAEVDPNQKERIIRALKKRGHVVGYMGDGINDAPALHDADVSISVESAVDVAREAANFVLLESDLDVLRRGIEEGRSTFANSLKYVFTTTSANFGNMLSMAGASFFLPFLPLLAKQILLNNFLSDFPALAIAQDNVDQEMVESPRRWDMAFIRNFMIIFGLISSAFDFLTFGILLLLLDATVEQFRTGWFVESLMTELLVALVVRTRRPFYKSRPSHWLWVSTLMVICLTLVIPYAGLRNLLGFVPLSLETIFLLVLITILYTVVTDGVKCAFYKRARASS